MSPTPGPWIWLRDGCTLVHLEEPPPPHPYAGTENRLERIVLAIDLPEFIEDDDKALIAAAPDLLEAVKVAVDLIEDYVQGRPEVAHEMRAAIAKAEGR